MSEYVPSSGNGWEENIPDRMRRGERDPNPLFKPEERLFLRITPEKWANTSHHDLGFLFRVGDQSVNRSWPDGQWDDVLLWEYPKYSECGVLQFEVRDLPPPHDRGKDVDTIEFRPVHLPEDMNFYHSEIQGFRADIPDTALKKMPGRTKTFFRLHLNGVLSVENILREPVVEKPFTEDG